MKTLIKYLSILMLVITTPVLAEDGSNHAPYIGSAEFERLKGLAGTWQGSTEMQGEEQQVQVEYRVTAAGSAVVETHFPGTPHEMVTVYHDEGGKPGMTHYCALKNQPNMTMDSSSDNSMHFNFSGSDSVDANKDAHMHELTIHFVDQNRIEQDWVLYQEGKPVDTTRIELQRI